MLVFPEEFYAPFRTTLQKLGMAASEEDEVLQEFEQTLLVKLAEAIAQKLPEDERQNFLKLIEEDDEESLKRQISEWINEQEMAALIQKLADNLFVEFLQATYKNGSDSQKVALEEMFKMEVLRG